MYVLDNAYCFIFADDMLIRQVKSPSIKMYQID